MVQPSKWGLRHRFVFRSKLYCGHEKSNKLMLNQNEHTHITIFLENIAGIWFIDQNTGWSQLMKQPTTLGLFHWLIFQSKLHSGHVPRRISIQNLKHHDHLPILPWNKLSKLGVKASEIRCTLSIEEMVFKLNLWRYYAFYLYWRRGDDLKPGHALKLGLEPSKNVQLVAITTKSTWGVCISYSMLVIN